MEDVREVRIIGPRCTSQEALHAFVAKKLGFPDYYGGNLAALADCLSEMGVPTRITIAINDYEVEPGMQAYLLRFVQVCAREAFVNENITLVIEHP
ncbi:MAG: barstar family protein [Eggerthellaceae bacterium]|nr:barstar family protein [Eggerthellaceae bacterium]